MSKIFSLPIFFLVLVFFSLSTINVMEIKRGTDLFHLQQPLDIKERLTETNKTDTHIFETKFRLLPHRFNSLGISLGSFNPNKSNKLTVTDLRNQTKTELELSEENRYKNQTLWFLNAEKLPLADGEYEVSLSLEGGFPKKLFLNYTPELSPNYIIAKISQILDNPETHTAIVLSVLPVIVFLIWLPFSPYFEIPILSVLTLLLLDLFFFRGGYAFIYTGAAITWLFVSIYLGISGLAGIVVSLPLLSLSLIAYLTNISFYSDLLASWSYFFLFCGLISIAFEKLHLVRVRVGVDALFWGLFDFSFINTTFNDWFYSTILLIKPAQAEAAYWFMIAKETTDKIIRFLISLPFIAASVIFIKRIFESLISTARLYQDFYPDSASGKFIFSTVIYIFPIILLTLILITVLGKTYRQIVMVSCTLSLITFLTINRIIDITTPFRNEVFIKRVTPSSTTEAWVDINVIGINFKDNPFIGKIEVAGIQHRVIKWTDKIIIFRTDPMTTESGPIKVFSLNGKSSNQVNFEYFFDK